MVRKYLALDIETSREVPGSFSDWEAYRPLGIACAATLPMDTGNPVTWYGKNTDLTPRERMSRNEAINLVNGLMAFAREDYTILTWNGLGFDFNVLAEESGLLKECSDLARSHVDMMFHVYCKLGYPVAIDRAAAALGIQGKFSRITGEMAPKLWAQRRFEEVLKYVSEDARIANDIAVKCERRGSFSWITQAGRKKSMDLSGGWRTVSDAITLPAPDTSWMDNPIPLRRFTGWLV